ncbi:MAG TPA: M56 family metallopeptidase [Saprospiraceae bacterium]|nr:M56 family metallopeptidase [Saprospiraceae bacterium]
MNFLNEWMQSDWLKALGWTFVHSLWQIAITGLLLYVILRLIPGRSAHIRYTISTMAIWLIVIMALSTFIVMLPNEKLVTEITGQVILVKTAQPISMAARLSIWLESHMPMMLTIWLGGVMILMMRLLLSLGWVNHMRSTATISEDLQQNLNDIIHRLHLKVRPVTSISNYVHSPVTIGHLKPLILFPIGIINQLTPREVEAILTHELAHIVRRDYLSNLIQSFIETLFYYHPVIWWISAVVRTERENRADDLAVSWCGDQLGYVKALMTVQEMQAKQSPLLAIGFASRKGAMLARIQRILHIPYKNHNQMEKTVLLSLCSLCFLAFTLTSEAKNNNQDKKENIAFERTELITASVDTIPSNGTYRIHKKTDNQEINIEVEDGDIKELQIDGKEIEPENFDDFGEIIGELFGSIDAPPAMEGFYFDMPAMPPMPEMQGFNMPPMPPMPPMPAMSPMEQMELERIYGNGNHIILRNGDHLKQKFWTDSLGQTQIIIIGEEGDSSVIFGPGNGNGNGYKFFHGNISPEELEQLKLQEKDWKIYGKEWDKQGKEWEKHGELWQKMAEEWQNNSAEWEHNWQAQQEELRELQGDLEMNARELEEEAIHGRLRLKEGKMYGMDDALRAEELAHARVYGIRVPGMNMTEAMVEDGLIDPGEEAIIQLTPDKLKINGKKMDSETHKKYLRMYENQQGIELTGNSRVEFKTKYRRSM